ncbi:hypothetical protein [Aquabacterium sp.]|uniref:hypothetical protein n=1 Tax=Aquabacterium sp. TaxID=1872578 RepID=UPI0035AF18F3
MMFRPLSLALSALLGSLLIACGSQPPVPPAVPVKPAAPPGPPPVVHVNTSLEKCPQPLGSVVVNEDTGSIWFSQLRDYKLPPTTLVLRVLVRQSGCFSWVDRPGTALRGKPGKAEASAKPDFTLAPTLSLTENAGKVPLEATVTLALQDNRSTVQLAETEGAARYVDINLFSPLFTPASAGTAAYMKSPEGRVVAASFVDAFNLLVRAARNYQAPPAMKAPLPTSVPGTRL